ncbi:MAG: PAC2 family protein [Dehalococcoidia bacterium]
MMLYSNVAPTHRQFLGAARQVMPYTHIEQIPSLRNPLLVAAFAGWNDAAESATTAARLLVEKWSARRFADIDPEEFYDFTSARPTVSVGPDHQRSLTWPANSFFYHVDPALERDVVVLVGIEPQLKWRAFTAEIMDVAKQCDVGMIVTLGAMLGDVPHTREVPLIGFATDPQLLERLRALRVGATRYQGPTGIPGVIHDACQQADLPAISLWASVPHYLGISQNPKVARALVATVDALFTLGLDLDDIDRAVERFEQQVTAIIGTNPEAAAYLQDLERRADAADESPEDADLPPLPPSEMVIKDLEEFLKRRRRQEGD